MLTMTLEDDDDDVYTVGSVTDRRSDRQHRQPTVTITPWDEEVTEGNHAIFSIGIDRTPASAITVNLRVTESGSCISPTTTRVI